MSDNGELTNAFLLSKSMKQGCPLAPLLFAICSDGLGWLVKDCLNNKSITGIHIFESNNDLCL